jgi:hypothetical protein
MVPMPTVSYRPESFKEALNCFKIYLPNLPSFMTLKGPYYKRRRTKWYDPALSSADGDS